MATSSGLRPALLLLCGLIAAGRWAAPSEDASPPQASLLAYLADRTVLLIDPVTFRVEARLVLSETDDDLIAVAGHYLDGLGPDTVIVLLPPAEAVIVSLRPLRVARRVRLPGDGRWSSLDVGPRSGDLYLFGKLADGRPLVSVLRRDGTERRRHVLARVVGPDWDPHQGIVDSGETRAYVSYHGSSTSGADILWLETDSIRACPVADPGQSSVGLGCLRRVHGALLEYGGDILFATGTGVVGRLSPASGDVTYRYIETGVPGHLMGFDVVHDTLYAVAPCGYGAGISAVPLGGGDRRAQTGLFDSVCGRTIAALGRGVAAVGHGLPVTMAPTSGRLLFVDVNGPEIKGELALSAPAVDLLLVSSN